MANEHTLVIQKTLPVPFTVADGTGINKGSLLKATSPRTASQSDGTDDLCAGIAATEKIASDGRTTLGVIVGPGDEFIAQASGTITVGDSVGTISGFSNFVASNANTADLSGFKRLGFALQSVTNGQDVRYRLDIGTN
jgi:hypothetical protein